METEKNPPPQTAAAAPAKSNSPLRIAVLILALAALTAATIWISFKYGSRILSIVSSKESVEAWLEGFGAWAFLAYIGLQIIQTVIFIIPGEIIQVAGGYFFGIGPGLLFALTGAVLGSGIAFMVARLLGRGMITMFIPEENLQKFDHIIASPRAQILFFLLFLIPGLPKDVLCYVGGLSPLSLFRFLAISTLGRLPSLSASIFFGSAVADGNWTLAWIIAGAAAILFAVGLWKRQSIHDFLDRHLSRDHKKSPD